MTTSHFNDWRNSSIFYLRTAHTLIKKVCLSVNESSTHSIDVITDMLDKAWINESNLHNENIRPFITAIHALFMQDKMRKFIEKVLANPKQIQLDPRITIIYNGWYLVELVSPRLQWTTQSSVTDIITWK